MNPENQTPKNVDHDKYLFKKVLLVNNLAPRRPPPQVEIMNLVDNKLLFYLMFP